MNTPGLNLNILVVDDDPLAGEMTAAILEDAGHTCQIAAHGVEALEILAQETTIFNLIISDLHMPLLTGIELFQELRSQNVMMPFVLLSGDDPAAIKRAAPGITACVPKDSSLEDNLLRALAKIFVNDSRK